MRRAGDCQPIIICRPPAPCISSLPRYWGRFCSFCRSTILTWLVSASTYWRSRIKYSKRHTLGRQEPAQNIPMSRLRIDPSLDQCINLPDDWRADNLRDLEERCRACHWNGLWDNGGSSERQKGLFSRALNEIDHGHENTWSKKGSKLHLNIALLQQSANAGNICCAILLSSAQHLNPDKSGPICSNRNGRLRLGASDTLGEGEDFPWRVFACCDEGSAPPGIDFRSTIWVNSNLSVDTSCDASLAWARNCIEDCLENHECGSFQSTDDSTDSLPTRLIYIPIDPLSNGVTLVETASLKGSQRSGLR